MARRRLLLARDRLGEKPLFYHHRGDALLLASEIKGLLADSSVSTELNLLARHRYLALRFVPSPLVTFRGIAAVPPWGAALPLGEVA